MIIVARFSPMRGTGVTRPNADLRGIARPV